MRSNSLVSTKDVIMWNWYPSDSHPHRPCHPSINAPVRPLRPIIRTTAHCKGHIIHPHRRRYPSIQGNIIYRAGNSMGTSSSSKPRVVAPTKPSPEVELESAWSIGCCHRRPTYATWDCTTERIAQRKAAPVEPFRVRFGRVSWQLRCRKDRGKRKERNLERSWRF